MKTKKSKVITIAAIAALVAVLGTVLILTTGKQKNNDIVILQCNGIDITKSVYQMYLHSTASSLKDATVPSLSNEEYEALTEEAKGEYLLKREKFWELDIDGKNVFELVKEQTWDAIKTYAYFKSECQKNNIKYEEKDLQALRSIIETNLQDVDTLDLFGIEKHLVVSYMIEMDLFDTLLQKESAGISVTADEITKKFDENRLHYAEATVKTIFLKDKEGDKQEEKKALAYTLKEKIQNGENMDDLIREYSDYKGNENGKFIVRGTSSIKSDFGSEYIESVLNSKEGDVSVLKTSKGYGISQTIKLNRMSTAEQDFTKVIREEKYMNSVESTIQNNERYTINIINESQVEQAQKRTLELLKNPVTSEDS